MVYKGTSNVRISHDRFPTSKVRSSRITHSLTESFSLSEFLSDSFSSYWEAWHQAHRHSPDEISFHGDGLCSTSTTDASE